MPTEVSMTGAVDHVSSGARGRFEGLDELLPGLGVPWWVLLIGEPYVCDSPLCAEHAHCLDARASAAPKAGCGCHNCAQRRWQKQREQARRHATVSEAALQHAERKQAARRPKGKHTRLARSLAGEHTRSRAA